MWLLGLALSLLLTNQDLRAQSTETPQAGEATSEIQLPDLTVAPEGETDKQRVVRLFKSGQYDDAAALAQAVHAAQGQFSVDERWSIFAARSQMATGKYADALKTLDEALKRFPRSIRLRWIGAEICRYNDDMKRAAVLLNEINTRVGEDGWRYRDVENQLVIAKYLLAEKIDAKRVVERILDPIQKLNTSNPNVLATIGQLALDKHDFALAAENFSKAIELAPDDADLYFGLAEAYRPSDHEKVNQAIANALALNRFHVPSLLAIIDQHVKSENYSEAESVIAEVLRINPHQPVAWAYRAVLAHLDNEPAKEGECRETALAYWPGNPEVDHLIGRELSQKYRFSESVDYQRRSLVYDSGYLPAKMQLAHDLLRLGQELEGWKLADEVFDEDEYSVVAHNLVTLRENLSKFRTLQGDGFVVRMEESESYIYGQQVLQLLTEAKNQLCEKYEVELEAPIFIEIFPRQQDFAIRTFGLPGGSGFLGVCFGRLVTMNSPAAQGSNLTSWKSVLWHEFCHVVTLQKTKNKMPRWLSEGISVYEECLADSAWGETINPKYREMMLGEELTPISKLSGAFLAPPSPLHLQFAYFEASLVVRHLVDEYGIAKMIKVLDELSVGTPINDALRRHMAPVEFLDKQFASYAKKKAESFAAGANWEQPDLPPTAGIQDWHDWNSQHPRNMTGLLMLGKLLIEGQDYHSSLETLSEVLEIDSTSVSAYVLQAKAYRELGEFGKEQASLETLTKHDADSVEPLKRLLELTTNNRQWEKAKTYARRLTALNPLIPAPHRYLSIAAEKTGDDIATIESLSVLTRLNPLDRADIHFRLASALFRENNLPLAKRHVLMALEQAPRYRDAHQLLLSILAAGEVSNEPASDSSTDVPATEETVEAKDAK